MHYHGTPITPVAALYETAGSCYCVSHARPDQVERAHQIGQSVMLDNGAFTAWRQNRPTDWLGYYAWTDRWLDFPTTWAVIPDVIDAGTQAQDALIRDWPHGQRGAPVWHMDEPISRLLRLCDEWPRVCIGSTENYRVVLSTLWRRRMDQAWNEISTRHRRPPWVHMLRGMQLAKYHWPFASADSTDVAQNHHLPRRTPKQMVDRWNAAQTPGRWEHAPAHPDFFEVAPS
jgi:hypothetical protein